MLLLALACCTACAGRTGNTVLQDAYTGTARMSARIQDHVRALADIGPRCLEKPGSLSAAADYIISQLRAMGYPVRQDAYSTSRGQSVTNLEAVVHGGLLQKESILAVAHYDTVAASPGADDNGSGVAALLEIARLARLRSFKRSLRFLFTVNEELPTLRNREKGAVRRARQARTNKENIRAVLVVDSVGCYSDRPGSQNATSLKEFTADKGNFLALLALSGTNKNKALLPGIAQSFARQSTLPVRSVTLGWGSWPYYSDMGAFSDMGYATVLATDTGPLRNPHYHKDSDLPDTLDYSRTVQAARGLANALFDLASE